VERAIENSSRPGDLVLDAFGGSGSTLIACERLGRKARVVELAPNYVDVIVRRWQEFTGQSAVLAGDGLTFAEISEQRAAGAAPLHAA
jgi:DNA modification methylase